MNSDKSLSERKLDKVFPGEMLPGDGWEVSTQEEVKEIARRISGKGF